MAKRKASQEIFSKKERCRKGKFVVAERKASQGIFSQKKRYMVLS